MRDAFMIDLGADIDLGGGWGLTTEVGGATGSGCASSSDEGGRDTVPPATAIAADPDAS